MFVLSFFFINTEDILIQPISSQIAKQDIPNDPTADIQAEIDKILGKTWNKLMEDTITSMGNESLNTQNNIGNDFSKYDFPLNQQSLMNKNNNNNNSIDSNDISSHSSIILETANRSFSTDLTSTDPMASMNMESVINKLKESKQINKDILNR